jgi:hypothetical protein
MGNLAGNRKSHSIKKDHEGIEHSSCYAFHFLTAHSCALNRYRPAPKQLRRFDITFSSYAKFLRADTFLSNPLQG